MKSKAVRVIQTGQRTRRHQMIRKIPKNPVRTGRKKKTRTVRTRIKRRTRRSRQRKPN